MSIHSIPFYIFGIFIICTSLLGCNKDKGYQPKAGTITESVYASGNVKAEQQYKVFSSVSGILVKRHVNVGDSVKKGDTIFSLQNETAEFTIDNSLLALKRTQENLKKINEIEKQVELKKDKYLQDSLMFVRQKRLWEQGASTKVQFENAELSMKAAKMEFLNSSNELQQTRNILKTEYEAAKNNVSISKQNAEGYIIRSETNGRVYIIYPEEGEGITQQTVLAIIGKKDKFNIQIQVNENDISRIQTGQEIFVTMDSYKDSLFKAVVTNIYPIMNENTGTFSVEGVFTKSPSMLYPNLNLEANILIGSRKNAMIVPREYLIDDTYVLLEKGQKAKVKVGLKNYEYAEIVSGLNKGQMIYKP